VESLGSGGSTIISAGVNLSLLASTSINTVESLELSAAGTLSLQGASVTVSSGNLKLVGGVVTLDNSFADAPVNDVLVVAPGSLSLSNGSTIYGGNGLGIYGNTSGSALAGPISLTGDSQLHSGVDVGIDAASISMYGSNILASTGDVLVEVTDYVKLENGSYIKAGNDVDLTLYGSGSQLTLNTTYGGSPSYIWAVSPNTIYVSFPLLADGGIVIDGASSILTTSGSSGFFVGPSLTPAAENAGLVLTYLPKTLGSDVITSSLLRAVDSGSLEDLPDQGGGLLSDDAKRLSGFTAGGEDDEFGDEEGKERQDKNGRNQNGSSNSSKKRVATCS
jgi:hypothetical protein